MQADTPDEYQLHQQLQGFLRRTEPASLGSRERLTLQRILANLTGGDLATDSGSDSLFSAEDLRFIEAVRLKKVHPEVIQSLKTAMRQAIHDPMRGQRLQLGVYTQTFLRALSVPTSGKPLVLKLQVRRRYRLIYAFGGGLTRPYFLEFDHRKDVYKHHNLGTSS